MRKFFSSFGLALMLFASPIVGAFIGGCTTSQQTVAYKTIYGVEVATTSAYDAYAKLVIKGTVSTNDLAKVSAAYNKFQKAVSLSIAVSQNSQNAFASDALVKESAAVLDLIAAITKK